MSLRARIAVWSLVVALLTSGTLTALFAGDSARARIERLRAEGRRVALSAVTLYDVLRLTGSEADRATLQSFLHAAVDGNADEREIAWAAVVDEKGAVVASAVNARVIDGAPRAPVTAAHAPAANPGPVNPAVAKPAVANPAVATFAGFAPGLPAPADLIVVDVAVIAHDAANQAPDGAAGRVVVALSTKPARAALLQTVAVAGVLSLLVASLFAGALVLVVTRRIAKPIGAVVAGMRAVKAGRLETVDLVGVGGVGGGVHGLSGAHVDEAAQLVDGFNDMVAALADKAKLASTLERHVGKQMAGEIRASAVGSGRRLPVTALFLDVEGFTARVSRDAPESVVAFVQELVSACVAIIEGHRGHVARMFGDSILALWGVGGADVDDPRRAVAAALALVETCSALSEARRARDEEPFSVGVGVATGEAVLATVGNDDRAESIAVGEPIALARHIEEEARAADFGVLVSEETFRAVSSSYHGAATPPILIRGFGVPLTLYRVKPRKAPSSP